MKLKTFAQHYQEAAPTMSTGPGVDMNPTGKKSRIFNKIDRRSRWDLNKMYDRSKGNYKK